MSKNHMALTGICIASFLGCIDLTVVNTIIPAMSEKLNIPFDLMQWVSSSFMIALSATMVITGKLSDRFGRKFFLLIGLFLFGGTSLIIGIAYNFWLIVILRFFQGIGCAVLYTVSGAIISNMFDKESQAKAMGILFDFNGLGLALGPVIGGLLSGVVSWRAAFLVNIPFVLVSLFLTIKYVTDSKNENASSIDIVGGGLITVFLISLVSLLSVGYNETYYYYITFSVIFMVLFVAWEIRAKTPIVDFKLFINGRFCGALAASFFLAFCYSSVLFNLPIFLSQKFGLNDVKIGLLLLFSTGFFTLTSMFSSKLNLFTPSKSILTGLLLFFISFIAFSLVIDGHGYLELIGPLVIFGIGWALILSPSTLVALDSFPDEQAGVAMGTSWTLHNVGGAFGVAISISMVTCNYFGVGGILGLFILLASLSLLAFLFCLLFMKSSLSKGT